MNPIWALLFKDRIRTPFSVYKMSLAEVVFLISIIFGAGWSIGQGAKWIIDSAGSEKEIVETVLE